MSYSNLNGKSPITLSQFIAIYSGTATDGDSIAAELGNVQQGSLYIATDGSLYHKYRSTGDGNAWYRIAVGTPETEKRLAAAATTLLANDYRVTVIKAPKTVTATLGASDARLAIKKTKGDSATLSASTPVAVIKKTKSLSTTLTPSCTATKL